MTPSALLLTNSRCATFAIALFALLLHSPPAGAQSAQSAQSAHSVYTPYAFANFAGLPGGPGGLDGTANAARFNNPSGIAVDRNDNIYVADAGNAMIRRITPDGIVTTLAGSAGQIGSADGTGSLSRFNYPVGIAVDGNDNIYVADSGNTAIRKLMPAGTNWVVTTLAGRAGQWGANDGTGGAARFGGPYGGPAGLAVDGAGNVYVADQPNHTVRKVTPDGTVTTLAGSAGQHGTNDGIGSAARFFDPVGVAVDGGGNVYITDLLNYTIRKITPDGVVTTLAGRAGRSCCSEDGTGSAASFSWPQGVAADGGSNVYVADDALIRKIEPDGAVTTLAGSARGYMDGVAGEAQFLFPSGVAVGRAGTLFVADTENHIIRKISPDRTVTTLAGRARQSGSADGSGDAARFYSPFGVAADRAGNVYGADTGNRTIRKITPEAVVTTLAGSAGLPGTNDGLGSVARFLSPRGVAVDANGNIYVADTVAATIRKLTPDGVVTTLAGGARQNGTNDGPGATARFGLYAVDFAFFGPSGVAADGAGNVYVADTANHTIRKITPDAVVTTLAGRAGQSGAADGTGSAAQFFFPAGVAADAAGTIYVADTWNSVIRKITPGGAVTTLAGSARQSGTNDGTGSTARFYQPYGVAVDSAGNAYVADTYNGLIRKITPAGEVTTLAGSAGQPGDAGGIGGAARFRYPTGVAADGLGNVYVADSGNDRIAKGGPPNHAPTAVVEMSPLFAISPNETNLLIVSPNNTDAAVILDGSQSSDADNDPLQFAWFADGAPGALATGRVAAVVLAVGAHEVALRVDDGQAAATDRLAVRVITAADAVMELMGDVQAMNLRHPEALFSQLSAAGNGFAAGKFELGVVHLQLFQKRFGELPERDEIAPDTAAALIQEAQAILAAVGGADTP